MKPENIEHAIKELKRRQDNIIKMLEVLIKCEVSKGRKLSTKVHKLYDKEIKK